MAKNFTTIGVPQFQGGFNLNLSLPITGEGVVNRLNRTKQLINRDPLKLSVARRFTSPQYQAVKDWGSSRMQSVKLTGLRANLANKLKRLEDSLRALKFQAKYGAGYDYNKVKSILLELVNHGYKIAVDGDWGKLAESAWQKYLTDKRKKITKPNDFNISNLFDPITKLFSNTPYPVSTNKNELAIADHKINSNVKEPYWVLDRNTNLLKHKKGNLTLALFSVMSGLSKYDGTNTWTNYNKYKDGSYYNLLKHAMSTPAGIFTLKSSSYDGVSAFRWVEGERGNEHQKRSTSVLFHKMPDARIVEYNKGVRNKSYGCVNLPIDALNYMIKNQAVGDSVYSLPVDLSNYIYESLEQGHPLKINYNNAPKVVSGKHYNKEYTLPLIYNTGY